MSAILSGAAAAALAAGLAAGLALESGQVEPHIQQVQHHGPPGPALIEKLEASATRPYVAARGAPEPVPDDVFGIVTTAISDPCQSDASSITLDAMVCAITGNAESLLGPLLAGMAPVD